MGELFARMSRAGRAVLGAPILLALATSCGLPDAPSPILASALLPVPPARSVLCEQCASPGQCRVTHDESVGGGLWSEPQCLVSGVDPCNIDRRIAVFYECRTNGEVGRQYCQVADKFLEGLNETQIAKVQELHSRGCTPMTAALPCKNETSTPTFCTNYQTWVEDENRKIEAQGQNTEAEATSRGITSSPSYTFQDDGTAASGPLPVFFRPAAQPTGFRVLGFELYDPKALGVLRVPSTFVASGPCSPRSRDCDPIVRIVFKQGERQTGGFLDSQGRTAGEDYNCRTAQDGNSLWCHRFTTPRDITAQEIVNGIDVEVFHNVWPHTVQLQCDAETVRKGLLAAVIARADHARLKCGPKNVVYLYVPRAPRLRQLFVQKMVVKNPGCSDVGTCLSVRTLDPARGGATHPASCTGGAAGSAQCERLDIPVPLDAEPWIAVASRLPPRHSSELFSERLVQCSPDDLVMQHLKVLYLNAPPAPFVCQDDNGYNEQVVIQLGVR